MTLFGDFKRNVQLAYVAKHQGLDISGLSLTDLLAQLYNEDRETYNRLMLEMFTHKPDPEREANIRRVRELDKVDFHGDSSIDTEKRFETFFLAGNRPTLSAAYTAAGEWVRGLSPYLLTLSGPPGVGKTHLALAAAYEVFHRDQPIIYRTEKGLLDQMHQAMRKGEEGPVQIMGELIEIPWLVLDDLGAGAVSDWDKTQMDQLINLRWQGTAAQKRTLVTTNLVGEHMSPRMASRLSDIHVAKAILIRAQDYRRQSLKTGGLT